MHAAATVETSERAIATLQDQLDQSKASKCGNDFSASLIKQLVTQDMVGLACRGLPVDFIHKLRSFNSKELAMFSRSMNS